MNELRTRSEMRQVLLVDDHAPTLISLVTLLCSEQLGIEVVGLAMNKADALKLVSDTMPDVVVLDLDLGGENGLELIPPLVANHGVSVIILSCSEDPLKKKQGLAAGAAAFVSKLSPVDELISAIQTVPPRKLGMGGLSYLVRELKPTQIGRRLR